MPTPGRVAAGAWHSYWSVVAAWVTVKAEPQGVPEPETRSPGAVRRYCCTASPSLLDRKMTGQVATGPLSVHTTGPVRMLGALATGMPRAWAIEAVRAAARAAG